MFVIRVHTESDREKKEIKRFPKMLVTVLFEKTQKRKEEKRKENTERYFLRC